MGIWGAMRDAASLGTLWAVLTLGAFISYKVLDFPDLSVDGTFALGGAVSATLIVKGMNPFLALPIAIMAGMLGGLCTALLHTKLKIPGLLSGILTMLALYSINLRIMSGSNKPLLGTNTAVKMLSAALGLSRTISILVIGSVTCALLVGAMYWFFGTELGCAIRASGDNPHMARALGTNTNNMIIIGLCLSNGLVALAGALVAQGQGFADVSMGTGAMVIGLASIIIGEVMFKWLGRNFAIRLLAVVLGAVLYRVIIAVVLQLGLKAEDFNMLSAMMMVIVMSVPLLRDKLRALIRGKEAE